LDPAPYLLLAGVRIDGKEEQISLNIIKEFPPKINQLTFYNRKKDEPHRVEVVGTPEFKVMWSQILHHAGAKVVDRLFTLSSEARIDYILSDPEPTDMVIEKAQALGKPLCTTEWLVQSLLVQKVLDPTNHKTYKLAL